MKDKLKNILKTCGWERCIVAVFLVLVMAVGSVSLIVLPKEDFSPDENRMLEEFPTISGESLIDSSFMTGVENFVSDHFMLRRDFIALHTQIMLASGKKDLASNYGTVPAEGGVYFGKNDHIYEVLLPPDRTTVFEDNITSITGFSKKTYGRRRRSPVLCLRLQRPAGSYDRLCDGKE